MNQTSEYNLINMIKRGGGWDFRNILSTHGPASHKKGESMQWTKQNQSAVVVQMLHCNDATQIVSTFSTCRNWAQPTGI